MQTSGHYTEEISRQKPGCFLFLIDQSGSMEDPFGGLIEGATNPKKMDGAADAVNRCLSNISIRCTKGESIVDWFYVGVWGYHGVDSAGTVLHGASAGKNLVPISELYAAARMQERRRKVSDGAGGTVEETIKFSVWVEPKADGKTPMCTAFRNARDTLSEWMKEHPTSYPPSVINITDGAATDGDPAPLAKDLMALKNANGSAVLVFNIHVCDARLPPILYPNGPDGLIDDEAKRLFAMSSILPDPLLNAAKEGGMPVTEGSRGFAFNAGLADLVHFLDVGTRTTAMTDLRPGR